MFIKSFLRQIFENGFFAQKKQEDKRLFFLFHSFPSSAFHQVTQSARKFWPSSDLSFGRVSPPFYIHHRSFFFRFSCILHLEPSVFFLSRLLTIFFLLTSALLLFALLLSLLFSYRSSHFYFSTFPYFLFSHLPNFFFSFISSKLLCLFSDFCNSTFFIQQVSLEHPFFSL